MQLAPRTHNVVILPSLVADPRFPRGDTNLFDKFSPKTARKMCVFIMNMRNEH